MADCRNANQKLFYQKNEEFKSQDFKALRMILIDRTNCLRRIEKYAQPFSIVIKQITQIFISICLEIFEVQSFKNSPGRDFHEVHLVFYLAPKSICEGFFRLFECLYHFPPPSHQTTNYMNAAILD